MPTLSRIQPSRAAPARQLLVSPGVLALAGCVNSVGGMNATARLTRHARIRTAERQLRPDVLDFILTFGTLTRAAGATHVTVVERRLAIEVRDTPLAARARGWIVVVADDGEVMTCYRRFDAVSYLRKRTKRRLSYAQLSLRRRHPRYEGGQHAG